jgi:hypothetical protein
MKKQLFYLPANADTRLRNMFPSSIEIIFALLVLRASLSSGFCSRKTPILIQPETLAKINPKTNRSSNNKHI